LTCAVRDTLKIVRTWSEQERRRVSYCEEILDRAVGVEEGGAHGSINVGTCKAHAQHVLDGGISIAAHGQR
jgi:hypothetical protein